MSDRVLPRWQSTILAVLIVVTPLIGVATVRANIEASQAACKGANEAKSATNDLLHVLVKNASRPIADATPAQLARQQMSIAGYRAFQIIADKKLAKLQC